MTFTPKRTTLLLASLLRVPDHHAASTFVRSRIKPFFNLRDVRHCSIGALLVVGICCLVATPASAAQVRVNGTNVEVAGGQVVDTGTTSGTNGHAVLATKNGTVTNSGPISISTGGANAYGVFVQTGASAFFDQADVTTTGNGSYGLDAYNPNSQITLTDSSVTTHGLRSNGVRAVGQGTITLTDVSVTTTGDASYGLQASGADSHVNAMGVAVQTSGENDSFNAATGVIVEGGATMRLTHSAANVTSIKTTGMQAVGMLAQTGGALVALGDDRLLSVRTEGVGAHGAFAYGAGSSMSITDADIATLNDSAQGVRVESGANVVLTGEKQASLVSTAGMGAAGAWASGPDTKLRMVNVNISSAGLRSDGAGVENGALLEIDGGQILTTGSGANGIVAAGGTAVIGRAADGAGTLIETTGDSSYGVSVSDGGRVQADGVAIQTQGSLSRGARVSGGGSLVLTDSTVATEGSIAYGLSAMDAGSSIRATNVRISTAGNNIDANASIGIVSEFGADVIVDGDSRVATRGVDAIGLLSQVGGDANQADTRLTFNGSGRSSISTEGELSHGAAVCSRVAGSANCTDPLGDDVAGVGARAFLDISNASVSTAGASAFGLVAYGQSAALNAQNVSVETSGEAAHASVVRNGATLSVSDSTLSASGANSAGLFLTSPAGTTGVATLSNVTLNAVQGASVAVIGGNADVELQQSVAQVNNGQWLNVQSTNPLNPAVLNASLNASLVSGAAITGVNDTSNVTLTNNTVWQMTGNSNVTNLENHASQILFSAPVGAPESASSYKTLTAANYVGQGGEITLNTYLAGDGSPSDRLVINGGSASGETGLRIVRAGGQGAFTPGDGIQVVETINGAATTPGAFSLANRVVAGPYEYQLFRGSRDESDGQGWYLRSEQAATQPNESSPETGTPRPLYRPETGAYLANQQQAIGMFTHSLHDRLGEPQWLQNQKPDEQGARRGSGWVRFVAKTADATSRNGDFSAKSDSTLIQGGGDLARWNIGGEDARLHVGGMLGYGEARTNASAWGNRAKARGKTEGWNLGAYGTWYQNDESKLGWYAEVWGSYGKFKNSVQGDGMPQVRYHSDVLTLSAETGYALKVRQDSDWIIEPQAQVLFTRYGQDDVVEANGTRVTDGNDRNGWISRLGVRTHRTWETSSGKQVQPYLTLNWWHDQSSNSLALDGVRVGNLVPDNLFEAKLGINADLRKGWSLWGNVGYQAGSDSYSATTVRVGAKYTW